MNDCDTGCDVGANGDSFHSLFGTLPDIDHHSQLRQIKSLLNVLEHWQEQAASASNAGTNQDMAYQCVYRDAAVSMAAVGALAPFIEGILVHMFACLREKQVPGVANHERWRAASCIAWNPHLWFDEKSGRSNRDVVKGTAQIMEALGIRNEFCQGLDHVLAALFLYRNKMLHNGNEWPTGARRAFEKTVSDRNWTDWFPAARIGNEPWCFYMSKTLINECIAVAEDLLAGFGRLLDTLGGRVTGRRRRERECLMTTIPKQVHLWRISPSEHQPLRLNDAKGRFDNRAVGPAKRVFLEGGGKLLVRTLGNPSVYK